MSDEPEIPPPVHDCEIRLLSYDPLLAILLLQTDNGVIEVAINKAAAGLMAMALAEFLSAEPLTDEEREATEGLN